MDMDIDPACFGCAPCGMYGFTCIRPHLPCPHLFSSHLDYIHGPSTPLHNQTGWNPNYLSRCRPLLVLPYSTIHYHYCTDSPPLVSTAALRSGSNLTFGAHTRLCICAMHIHYVGVPIVVDIIIVVCTGTLLQYIHMKLVTSVGTPNHCMTSSVTAECCI